MSKCIIVSASSDIGLALGHDWLAKGHELIGTYRRNSPAVDNLRHSGAKMFHCDLANSTSIERTCSEMTKPSEGWNTLVLAAGTLDPIGLFEDCDFTDWALSISINFTAQLKLLHALLPLRKSSSKIMPSVILFAGGGTNCATERYSAYTISKIASIKICELLDAEIPDTKFTIIGPGWVNTKIHSSTLIAGDNAGDAYDKTVAMLGGDDCVTFQKVIECVEWIISSSRDVVGGRNISLAHDKWSNARLDKALLEDADMYKLRRSGNDKLK